MCWDFFPIEKYSFYQRILWIGIKLSEITSGRLYVSKNQDESWGTVCDDNFEYIVFVDRTGVEVFKSYNKEFEWDGGGLSSGVYFYYIKYTKSDYRGSVTIIY